MADNESGEGTGELDVKDKKQVRTGSGGRSTGGKGRDGNVGNALRTVYDETVKEHVPQDLLDLLSKLS